MRTFTLAAFALALSACAKTPPPEAPAPEPPKEEPAAAKEPEPPPPPPPCVSLEEKCAAAADTTLAVGKASVKPPLGWTYAKEVKDSVIVSPDGDGFLVFAEGAGDKPEDELAAVTALVERLALTDVKLPMLKTRLKKPQSTVDASGTPVKLWEISKEAQFGTEPKKDGKPGAALVAIAKVGGALVVGVGYAPKTAPKTHVAAMMETIQSLRGGQ